MFSQQEHARNLVQLGFIEDYMKEKGFATQLIEKSAFVPVHSLMVGLRKDAKGRERLVNMTYVPLPDDTVDDICLLQLFCTLPFRAAGEHQRVLDTLLVKVNSFLPMGHFGVKDDEQIYFRYVCALPARQQITREYITEVMMMYTFAIETFSSMVEKVAVGEQKLEQALKELAEVQQGP